MPLAMPTALPGSAFRTECMHMPIHGSSFQIYCHNFRAVTSALASLSFDEVVLGSRPM